MAAKKKTSRTSASTRTAQGRKRTQAPGKRAKKKKALGKKSTEKKTGAKKKAVAQKAARKSTKKKAGKKKAGKKKAGKKKAGQKKAGQKKAGQKKAGQKKAGQKKAGQKKAGRKKAGQKKTGKKKSRKKGGASAVTSAKGKHLVIVESPAKAKTINKYLGQDFVVQASVGHIRDLPTRAPKGSKQPVPGVDLEDDFRPTYVVLTGKSKTVAELKRYARQAADVWFATDLDREGEAIAWHLAQELGIEPERAKRVVFNAITPHEVKRAFANPRAIDGAMVDAQQARRILDRIVGYQVSPLLWKKVARGLSAGRVQSVAVKLVVDREREIDVFVPDETWKVTTRLAVDPPRAPELAEAWVALLAIRDEKGKGPTVKKRNAWLAESGSITAELWELGGVRFELGCPADEPKDLSHDVVRVAEAVGMAAVSVESEENPSGKGPARFSRTVSGTMDFSTRYRVRDIETRRTTSRPSPPFITSSLQIAAANQLGFSAKRTMRTAQTLYEGVDVPGEGRVGVITYMRTDSTSLSSDALGQARGYVKKLGPAYLPDKPNSFSSSNKDAQEAHEAIRPTDVSRTPQMLRSKLTAEQYKLYNLIWRRFVACQMTPAKWDATAVTLERSDKKTGAVLRTTGRTLVFDGFYKVMGVPTASDEQVLPELPEGRELAPFDVRPEQRFSSPPPRYSEASLVKTLEAEGIGRPSTYASIISVIQDRRYVEQIDRRFYATDLGEVVTDKLIEAFPELMDVGYTRQMEAKLDQVEESDMDWVAMLREFYGPFARSLEKAHEELTHAKAEIQMAPYQCPECEARTAYRFGKNGRFLSCTRYPDCDYSSPIDREGRPQLPERVDIACPADGSAMELRTGRFGPFLASVNYPQTTFVLNMDRKGGIKYPVPPPYVTSLLCPKCNSPLNLRRGKRGPWLGCSRFPKCRGRLAWKSLEETEQKALERVLAKHETAHPVPEIRRTTGEIIPEGTPVAGLVIAGGDVELAIHPEAALGETG